MIPFEPEPSFSLAKRYPEAVERIYELHEMWGQDRPGMKRKHIFDFEDGLRLIISRERHDSNEVLLHWSASIDEDHLQRPPFQDVPDFMKFVMEHMTSLWEESGYVQGHVRVQSSEEGVIHFFMLDDSVLDLPECSPGDARMN